jgi:hypothetical protein
MLVDVIAAIGVYMIIVLCVIMFALLTAMNINYDVSGEIGRDVPAKVDDSNSAKLSTD